MIACTVLTNRCVSSFHKLMTRYQSIMKDQAMHMYVICKVNNLDLNVLKKVVDFRRGKQDSQYMPLKINRTLVDRVTSYKYTVWEPISLKTCPGHNLAHTGTVTQPLYYTMTKYIFLYIFILILIIVFFIFIYFFYLHSLELLQSHFTSAVLVQPCM